MIMATVLMMLVYYMMFCRALQLIVRDNVGIMG